jgi:DnaJ-class molecular chaperone
MSLVTRIKESVLGGGKPETETRSYRCDVCHGSFESTSDPSSVACEHCGSTSVRPV